ncbi:sulfite exporter TauE/SafE family protein [Nocardiopsis alborubida]|uniref:Probable membrane transporter protein n=1 Tax=Nocardiopsis alborubida TaxID=146802 RepID=A0A7X6MJU1_9ACTN|nr:TSUP family transporter [Nocardiopsis alborubida]NKZ02063.1 TSUP family transporter [Nocardiopsis alborubida]
MDPEILGLLLLVGVAAGWVDAVVGGGGLLLLPALLVAAPTTPLATLLGTNKLGAVFGTTSAALAYARKVRIDRRVVVPTAALALLGSGLGAAMAAALTADVLKPVIMVVLAGVALLVYFRPAMGVESDRRLRTRNRALAVVAIAGLAVSFYDGLIGPGTGVFLIIAFTAVVGMDFVEASASAKIVNVCTNLGALVVFGLGGHIDWLLGLGLAVCTIIGAQIGARMALRRGSGFVRAVLLVVVIALLVRMGWDIFT